MNVSLKIKHGDSIYEFSAASLKSVIAESSVLTELPLNCGLCGSTALAISHRQAQQYDFYAAVCRHCDGEYPMGQRRDGGGLFPKGPWAPRKRHAEE